MKISVTLLFFFLCIYLASSFRIGNPKGKCPNNYHYCEQRGCPFTDPQFCQQVQQICYEELALTPTCNQTVYDYCQTAPADPGCGYYLCDASKPHRCADTFVCVADARQCPEADPIYCAFYDEPCGDLTDCPGKYSCGNGACRDQVWDPCWDINTQAPKGSCGGYFPCGNGLCSQSPGECSPPSIPYECQEGVPNPGPSCSFFKYDDCPQDYHFCNFECSFDNRTFCESLRNCGDNCQNMVNEYCRFGNPQDFGCSCNDSAGYIRCPNNGLCVNDVTQCDSSASCSPAHLSCPYTSPCPGQYYCGRGPTGPICRASLSDPCPSGSQCSDEPLRPYPCGNNMCTPDPTNCIFGALQGYCPDGFQVCDENCPFANYTFCEFLGPLCTPQVGQLCLAAISDYCTFTNPSDRGCCAGATPERCPNSGHCVANLNECPNTRSTCVASNETCNFPCDGDYYCGPGATCRNSLLERCSDGPCKNRFYCGMFLDEPICSDSPLKCRDTTNYPFAPMCANGEHLCGLGCPFQDQAFCATLECRGAEQGARFDDLPYDCKSKIDNYCLNHTTDPFCCGGNTPLRCQTSYNCVADLSQCTSAYGCVKINEPCPATSMLCPNGFMCGGDICRDVNSVCPLGSLCPGEYLCDNGLCTKIAGQCNPPDAPYVPDCNNGGVACNQSQTCSMIEMGLFVCVCGPNTHPDLFDPTLCIPDGTGNNNGNVVGDCQDKSECGENQICSDGSCTCDRGFAFNLQTKACEPIKNPNPTVVDAQCMGSGDVHYTSFDGIYYDYQGSCDLVFLRAPGVEVHLRPFPCGTTVSCVESAAVRVGSDVVILNDTQITLNGVAVTSFPLYSAGLTIVQSYGYPNYKVLFPGGSVGYSRYFIQAQVNESFVGTTSGLCNNFSSSANYNLYHRDGQVTVSGSSYSPANNFAQSWIVNDTLGDPILFTNPNPNCQLLPNKRNFINTCSFGLTLAVPLCNPILTLANCSDVVDLSKFYRDCLFDVCASGDGNFAKLLIKDATAACNFQVAGVIEYEPPVTTGIQITGSQVTGSQVTGSQVTGSQVTGSVATGDSVGAGSSLQISFFSLFVFIFFALL